MMLTKGDKILISHRGLFERDEPRYFVGRVQAYESGIVKVTGFTFVRDVSSGQVMGKKDRRTKLVSLSSGTLIVYQLPEHTDIDLVEFVTDDGKQTVTDGKQLNMNLAELPHSCHI